MEKVKDKLKDKFGKVDKKALGMSIGLMLLSWAALPIVYWLIVRRKKDGENTTDKVTEEKANENG